MEHVLFSGPGLQRIELEDAFTTSPAATFYALSNAYNCVNSNPTEYRFTDRGATESSKLADRC